MFNHAIRLTLPYEDCSGIISRWADRSARAVVYQHDADASVSKTHVHIVLGSCEVKAEALKRMWSDVPGKGNEFWSWKDWNGEDKQIVYLTKGKYTPKFAKNFSQVELENLRQLWVEPVKADKPLDASEYYISKVLLLYDKYPTFHSFTDAIAEENGGCSHQVEIVLTDIRGNTMRMFFAETRRVPPATLFKTVAGTVFLRLCERWNCLSSGISRLQNLWY